MCIIAKKMKYFNKNQHHLISEDRILEIRCFLFTVLPHGKSLLSPDKLVIWLAVTDLGLYSIQQGCLMEQYPSWLYCSHPNGDACYDMALECDAHVLDISDKDKHEMECRTDCHWHGFVNTELLCHWAISSMFGLQHVMWAKPVMPV